MHTRLFSTDFSLEQRTVSMKFIFILLLSLSALADNARFDPTRLVVTLKENTEMPKSSLIKSSKHLFKNIYVVNTTDAAALEKELAKEFGVISTEKNYFAGKRELAKKIPTPKSFFNFNLFENFPFNDPEVNKIWSFLSPEANGVGVNKAYLSPLNIEKQEVIVAVVDTGVDYNHEDLKNMMWVNTEEIPGNGIDDDGNGYVDDIHGIDTLNRNAQGIPSGNPMDDHYHGTHVAGTIAAEQNNKKGIAGIAEKVKMMAIRAVPSNGDETDIDVVESFLYAAKMGARIINCSFGKTHNEGGMIVSEAIDYVGQEYGVLVFAAAGNDSNIFSKHDIDKNLKYPASFENDALIVIAATQKSGSLASFSNVGKKNVDLAAPGQQVYSTMPNNKYGMLSGTSMASPTAAGVAAEVLSHFPHLTNLELKEILMKTVTNVSKFKGYMVAEGTINLYDALQEAMKY